jgi:hypothetical protein
MVVCMQMVRVLVEAGADVHAKLTTGPHVGDTTVAHVLFHTNKDKPRLYDNAKQIMQVLIGEMQTVPPVQLSAAA